MIRKHLGTTIDIHGGGSDLTFPHHENEAAQSRCANNTPDYVKYWLHNGMLTMGQEKMSKSLGNMRTIHELAETWNGEQLRYALLSGQYRGSLAWSEDLIEQAGSSLDRLYQALRDKAPADLTKPDYNQLTLADFPAGVLSALCDDLNTPATLAALHELASQLQQKSDELSVEQRTQLCEQLLIGGWLMGLLQQDPEAYFTADSAEGPDATTIDALIEERNNARKNKNFARADEIREQLLADGVELKDTREGTRWRRL